MRLFRFHSKTLALLSLILFSAPALGQSTSPAWETLRPEGEDFSVLMPKGSTAETAKEPYHKMELNVRTYLSNGPAGSVFAVVSMSGIKSNPALYTEMQRFNSYVDAFKSLFPPKVRKDAIAKLSLVGEKVLYGHAGREYRMTLGDLTGTAQTYVTRKRFYSIVYLSTKANEALQEEFLSSFVIPEKVNPPPAQAAAASPAPEAVTKEEAEKAAAEAKPVSENPAKPAGEAASGDKAAAGKRPVHGGLLNSKALILPKPEYPADASSAGIEGVVVINVTIDEQGNVAEAHVISGPKLLQQPSLNAALQAKFSPTLVEGQAVRVQGVLVFNFGKSTS